MPHMQPVQFAPICSQRQVSVPIYHPATDGASFLHEDSFLLLLLHSLTIKYESNTELQLSAAKSAPHVKDFSSFQEHHLLRHLPLYCITKQEPSHGSDFQITGTPS